MVFVIVPSETNVIHASNASVNRSARLKAPMASPINSAKMIFLDIVSLL